MATVSVILLSSIPGLGGMGAQVQVKRGYFRNYLYPKGKALFASKENLHYFESQKSHFAKLCEAEKAEALALQEIFEKLDHIFCPREVKDSGELYGALTPKEVITALVNHNMPKLDIHQVHFPQSITTVGEYTVHLTLYVDVAVEVRCIVGTSKEAALDWGKDNQEINTAS